ncbi:MAG: hypothetical protein RL134_1063 [Actinomycetota bacterium]
MTSAFEDDIEDFYIHERGWPVERRRIAGQPVMLHYRDVPESDITTLHGIRLTTPLRTVIDMAPDVGMDHLEIMVRDCLQRGLFTVEEAFARMRQPDLADDPGAAMLWHLLRSR